MSWKIPAPDAVLEFAHRMTTMTTMTDAQRAALSIARMAKAVYDPDPWANLGARQAYRDSLEALRRFGVVDDYDLVEGTISIRGDDDDI